MSASSILPTNRDQQDFYQVSDTPRDLTHEDLAFLCRYTGKSADQLRPHVISVWKATKEKLWAFKCIQDIYFLIPKIALHPHYPNVLAAHANSAPKQSLLHMDLGCCYGQDTRQLILDGWRHQELAAIDLVPDYWDLGKELFMDQAELKVPFLAGSMADAAFISGSSPKGTPTEPLIGAADFCWAAAVLHCLSKSECEAFLRNAHALLKQGGSLYGTAAGFHTAKEHVATPSGQAKRFFHSQETLKQTLLEAGFCKVEVGLAPWTNAGINAESDEALKRSGNEAMILLAFTAVK